MYRSPGLLKLQPFIVKLSRPVRGCTAASHPCGGLQLSFSFRSVGPKNGASLSATPCWVALPASSAVFVQLKLCELCKSLQNCASDFFRHRRGLEVRKSREAVGGAAAPAQSGARQFCAGNAPPVAGNQGQVRQPGGIPGDTTQHPALVKCVWFPGSAIVRTVSVTRLQQAAAAGLGMNAAHWRPISHYGM